MLTIVIVLFRFVGTLTKNSYENANADVADDDDDNDNDQAYPSCPSLI